MKKAPGVTRWLKSAGTHKPLCLWVVSTQVGTHMMDQLVTFGASFTSPKKYLVTLTIEATIGRYKKHIWASLVLYVLHEMSHKVRCENVAHIVWTKVPPPVGSQYEAVITDHLTEWVAFMMRIKCVGYPVPLENVEKSCSFDFWVENENSMQVCNTQNEAYLLN